MNHRGAQSTEAELLSAAAPGRSAYARGAFSAAEPAPTLVIGLGNLIFGDEGVGVHAMRRLQAGYRFTPEIELVDGGTSGLDLLPLLQGRQRLLLIDALAADAPAGHMQVLRDDAIRRALTAKASLHHLGLADLLALAELTACLPPQVVLIGVVPDTLEMAVGLSERLQAQLGEVLATAVRVLQAWGIDSRVAGALPDGADALPS